MGTPLQKRSQVAAGASGWGGESNITRSAWFDSGDLLRRTPSSSGDLRNWTYSIWFRPIDLSSSNFLLTTYANASNFETFYHYTTSNNILLWYSIIGGVDYSRYWDPRLRDTEWYHAVLKFDSAQAAAADRVVLYLNGEEQTSYTEPAGTLPQNYDSYINRNQQTDIGYYAANGQYSECLKAQAAFVDGSSLEPTSFGEFITAGTNGQIWAPLSDAQVKTVVDAGGSNSFLLSSDIGDGTDDSSKSNTFTPTSMSDAANGINDTPSNPYAFFSTPTCTTTSLTIAEGGLNLTSTNANFLKPCLASFVMQTGKWFWMCEIDAVANNYPIVGISVVGPRLGNNNPSDYIAVRTTSTVVHTTFGGAGTHNGAAHGLTITTGTVVAFAFDADARTIWFGTVSGSTITWDGDPEAGTGGYNIDGEHDNEQAGFVVIVNWNNGGSGTMRAIYDFGQNGFALTGSEVTPPTGFNPQQPRYLPAPEEHGADLFNAVLYTGDGVAIGSGGNSITGVGFQPDLTWFKTRTTASNPRIVDSSRGATLYWSPDVTLAEGTETEGLDSFDADGFTVGSQSGYNNSGVDLVTLCWKVNGGTTVVNNDGDIQSTVQVGNFMSIVQYTGNATASQTIGHGLGATPDMIIVKNRIDGTAALVWFNTAGANYLNLSNTSQRSAGIFGTTMNSTVFEVESNSEVNGSGDAMVAYCFKNVPGVCQVGEFYGNGSNDGTFIHTGFRPRFWLAKSVSTQGWYRWDTARDDFNDGSGRSINVDIAAAESNSTSRAIDFLANGVKYRTSSSNINNNGTRHNFIAIADVASGTGLPPIPGR